MHASRCPGRPTFLAAAVDDWKKGTETWLTTLIAPDAHVSAGGCYT